MEKAGMVVEVLQVLRPDAAQQNIFLMILLLASPAEEVEAVAGQEMASLMQEGLQMEAHLVIMIRAILLLSPDLSWAEEAEAE